MAHAIGSKGLKKGLFLDRDGVLIEDTGFPHEPDKLIFCPSVIEACKIAQSLDYELVVITNQSGLARGVFSLSQYEKFARHLDDQLRLQGVFLRETYFCPHLKDAPVALWRKACDCRKPAPGLLLQAIAQLNIDPTESVMVGDRLTDLWAGFRAGVGSLYLVGSHPEGARLLESSDQHPPFPRPFYRGHFRNLLDVMKDLRARLGSLETSPHSLGH